MKRFTWILSLIAVAALAFSCAEPNDVSVGFALTDAPIDESHVTAVNVTVSEVAVNESADASLADGDGSWKTVTIDPPVTINLLDLQGGLYEDLGDPIVLAGGTQINQIRLGVDAVQVMEGDVAAVTTMPSATGLKIVNAFRVPPSGAITVTVDFDVRKSVVLTGSTYVVKPVLRAVVDNEAGQLTGTVPAGVVTVYAYTDGSYVDAEATTANADDLYFTGAYTSATVKADATYVLAFMDAGAYDLYGVDSTGAVIAELQGAVVTEGDVTDHADLTAIP